MKHLIIEHKIKIYVYFNADEWGILKMDGAENVADRLNSFLEFYVNLGFTRDNTTARMLTVMESYGASDTEPRAFLESVLDKIYAEPK